jgi:RND family efflux transporter MFP subunit
MLREFPLISLICALPVLLVAQPDAIPVQVAPALLEEKSTRTQLSGSVTSLRVARLSPRVEGLVEAIHVDVGSVVKSGDPLILLDARQARLALDAASLEKDRAAIALADAERLVEEVRELTATGGFSRSEASSRAAAAELARNQLALADTRVLEARDLLDRHTLPAPFDGIISHRLTEAGEWVATGTSVLELIDTESLVFDVRAPQEMFARSADAAEVTLILDAAPGIEFPATIDVRVPAKDEASRTFLIRLKFADPQNLAAHGMSGTATFTFQASGKSIQIPRDAIVRNPDGGATAWRVVEEEGRTLARPAAITPGPSLDGMVSIPAGLNEGDLIIIRGNEALRDGQPVTVTR